jgi:hypothetical protein
VACDNLSVVGGADAGQMKDEHVGYIPRMEGKEGRQFVVMLLRSLITFAAADG